jgi:hypothetical protein
LGESTVKQRSLERIEVDLPAVIHPADGSAIDATVSNISPKGCHIVCRHMLVIGSTIQLALPGAEGIEAKVMWQLGAAAGLNFTSEMPRSTFIRLFVPKKPRRRS